MLISEVVGKRAWESLKEYDVVDANLDTIIKMKLDDKKSVYTLDKLLVVLNKIPGMYFDLTNEDTKNKFIKYLESRGYKVDRGSGKITLGVASDVDTEDPGKVQKQAQTDKVEKIAMKNIQGKSTDAETIDGKL